MKICFRFQHHEMSQFWNLKSKCSIFEGEKLIILTRFWNIKFFKTKRKVRQTTWSESYHVMVGIGEPKVEQGSRAGLLVMTWYTWLGGVSTLGGSAIGINTTFSKSSFTISHFSHTTICTFKFYHKLWIYLHSCRCLNSPRTLTKAFAIR